jgi:hypothetical protein
MIWTEGDVPTIETIIGIGSLGCRATKIQALSALTSSGTSPALLAAGLCHAARMKILDATGHWPVDAPFGRAAFPVD